jgi:SAM-dependent methyltransferase
VIADRESSERDYWSRRLETHFSLRGTGHLSYSDAYNAWLYRGKRRALAPLLDRLPARSRVLDLGSGTGWVVDELLARGHTVEGCDLVDSAVERLRERHPAVEFFVVELGREPIPRPDASYDALTALDVLYHVTDDGRWRAALTEIARVLRPGGALVVSDGLGDRDRVPAAHVRFRSEARWSEAAASAGLELEEVRPLYRWLSRDPGKGPLSRLPGIVRGPVEYGLELTARRPPHMRLALLRRAA